MSNFLRVHHLEPISHANGPGVRSVLWLQGCTLGCEHCFNPETHAVDSGQLVRVNDVADWVRKQKSDVQGLTVTGGEPMQQAKGLVALMHELRSTTTLSILMFTGFSDKELLRHPEWDAIYSLVDIVISGRYDHTQRVASGLLGSGNKTTLFATNRYCQADLDRVPPAEVIVGENGEIMISGIDPLLWGSETPTEPTGAKR